MADRSPSRASRRRPTPYSRDGILVRRAAMLSQKFFSARRVQAVGYGLTYTTFDVSPPRLSKGEINSGESVGVDVDVTNTGTRVGDEIVQLYIRDDVRSVPRPIIELKAFERVTIKPVQAELATIPVE
jgi:beta-glucosidase